MQVIRELRQGVKLKKVDVETHLHPVEYELTPYEMLLDDIRSQRYKLNKVMVNGDLPPRVKKDAHALILDFIRSRPPLFPVSRRQLKPAPRRETSVHDRLMADIRQPQVLRPVRRRSTSSSNSVETSRTRLDDSDSTPQPRRRLIMADISLHLSSSFDDDDLDDTPTSPMAEQPHSLPLQLRRTPQRPTKLEWQQTMSCGDSPNVATTTTLKQKLERRHSITVCESPSRSPHQVIAQESAGRRSDKMARQESGKENWSTAQWDKSMECMSLTLEEVVHIRNVLTKAELESLLSNRSLYEDVEKRKVCFTCKKTKFSFFRPWGVKCKLCERTICDKCSTKMHIPTDRFDKIPIYMLCPTGTEEESPTHSPLPALFHFTSGSAPSSPILNSRPGSGATFNSKLNVAVFPPPTRPRVPKLRHAASVCNPPRMSEEKPPPATKRRPPLLRSRTFQHKASSPQEERLRGPLVTVCRDCKGMIRHIILASRTDMARSQRKACKPPPLCLSPVLASPTAGSPEGTPRTSTPTSGKLPLRVRCQ